MDNNWNLKTFGTGPPGAVSRLPVSTPLSREGSLYSWTLDQIQNNLGKDCGSMNIEELLMSIYSAGGTQGVVPTNGVNEGLQRQGSITLPRILSQKTVDEVWKYITEEELSTHNDGGRTNIPQIQKQPTLGDTTLEELLTRAGAIGNKNRGGCIHDPSSIPGIPNTSLNVEFQQKPIDVLDSINIVPSNRIHSSYLHPNANGSTSAYKPQQEQQQHNQFQPQQPNMSKPHGYGYGTHVAFTSGQVNAHGIRDSYMESGDRSHQDNNVTLVQSVAPVPRGAMNVDTCSQITPLIPVLDGIPKINAGSSIVSPFPYTTTGSNSVRDRNRKNGIAAEKNLVEKTHRRKIKNRESAARSRARKQLQTMELEAEAEKLRKENQELLKKQAEIMSEMQTKLGKGITNGSGKRLRRTKSDIQ